MRFQTVYIEFSFCFCVLPALWVFDVVSFVMNVLCLYLCVNVLVWDWDFVNFSEMFLF